MTITDPGTPGPFVSEHLVTVDSMNPGGWMRPTPSQVWREVDDVVKCASTTPCRCVSFRDGGPPIHVDPYTTYPYLSATEFEAGCDPERCGGLVADGACVLDYDHTGPCEGPADDELDHPQSLCPYPAGCSGCCRPGDVFNPERAA